MILELPVFFPFPPMAFFVSLCVHEKEAGRGVVVVDWAGGRV